MRQNKLMTTVAQMVRFKLYLFFQLIERDGRISKLRRRDPQYKKLIKSDLVYLEESPDYCDRNDE